jgi:hypothetical protein
MATKKILTDPEKMWTRCKVCKEPGNLENMIWQKIPKKDHHGKALYGSFEGIYFCSENCQHLFNNIRNQ